MSENWNLPNVLTTVRILLVPFFVWFLLAGGPFGEDSVAIRWAAFAVFAVAMYTDKLDGDIARARGLVTSFGKIADPIADKLLTGSAFIVLSLLGELWWWVTALILLREWGITAMRFAVLRYGVMPASRGGKLKTVLQAGALLLMLAPLASLVGDWYPWVGWTAMAAALAVTLVTGADYVAKAVRLRRSALAGQAPS
ncbi:CDP-diacylglycerol--glycerol-3-phosphate 3-phosphatidyltransferase [Citricoccus sp. SGAir0253]|uniref:CDP-diacylglycerol--glycerol-3-phosphate 3-phosphatidyltransferase n=1 Tax=Citricoccus sp. SGAir0253 TaxID=2567881 RepID=UPI0010CD400B|nr:CDP-diacylglycerol--glycerol-3-phosphate 3-phosphatidyltransferase [Citricoccus sp. SGAir0253]QCU78502.1 CDP-diacylglycerol--glycerol-3-phosphate 3-phosphatidyltransferase [Citricoccus sp. SGAir0253]